MHRLYAMVTALTVAALTMVNPPAAQACGDKLTVLGGGIPFDRVHSSHRQGSLILYLRPDSRLSATNTDARLDQMLTRNGHQVRVVKSGAELKQALEAGRADFVLADWSDAPQLQLDVIAGVPVVPVVYGSTAEERVYENSRSGCVVESNKGHNRQFVQEVESLLENQAGLAARCSGSVAAASG